MSRVSVEKERFRLLIRGEAAGGGGSGCHTLEVQLTSERKMETTEVSLG